LQAQNQNVFTYDLPTSSYKKKLNAYNDENTKEIH
jgi:hypothetical protein